MKAITIWHWEISRKKIMHFIGSDHQCPISWCLYKNSVWKTECVGGDNKKIFTWEKLPEWQFFTTTVHNVHCTSQRASIRILPVFIRSQYWQLPENPEILVENQNDGQILSFDQKSTFWSKIVISVKNQNAGQNFKFLGES